MPISIKNIQKAFGAKQVLNGIDYELEDGGIYCLMGPSGMGKTTLLRILMDLENPDGGDVEGLTLRLCFRRTACWNGWTQSTTSQLCARESAIKS